MHLRSSLAAFAAASSLILGLGSLANAAGAKDKAALALYKTAMDTNYLATDFAKAEKNLRDALKLCGASNCSPAVVGQINIGLGTVVGVGLNKMTDATALLVDALKADPNAKLDPNLSTPDLEKAFAEAKKQASGASGTAGSGGKGGSGGDETPPTKKPGGDLSHTPVAEQQIRTAVPVFIEIPEEVGAEEVAVKYKPFGGDKWKTAKMTKMGKGWGATIPCEDVTTTGDVKYYITAKDAGGDQVGSAGTLKEPYKVAIKQEIEGDPPALPGKKPPEQCKPPEDCPPGLPGCPGPGVKPTGPRGDKGWGASCEETQQCQEGLACLNGSCENDTGGDNNTGGSTPGKPKRNLMTVSAGLDMLIISGADNVCSGTDSAYSCFYADGSGQFYGKPATKDGTNGIQGGFGIGGARFLLSYDRQLTAKLGLMAGIRVGYAVGGSPSSDTSPPTNEAARAHDQAKSFFPAHLEARVSYHLGGEGVLEPKKFRPYFFLGGGAAQVNASVPVSVCDEWNADGSNVDAAHASKRCPSGQPSRAVDVNAYQITGLNFVGLGGGATFGITPTFGINAELKFMFMVPTFGIVIAPSVGPAVAF